MTVLQFMNALGKENRVKVIRTRWEPPACHGGAGRQWRRMKGGRGRRAFSGIRILFRLSCIPIAQWRWEGELKKQNKTTKHNTTNWIIEQQYQTWLGRADFIYHHHHLSASTTLFFFLSPRSKAPSSSSWELHYLRPSRVEAGPLK